MAGKLTARRTDALAKIKGRHGDGQGLFLRVLDPGRRVYWCYRYRIGGAEREMSLGPYPEFTLAAARLKHAEARKQVAVDKIDPVALKRAGRRAAPAAAGPTFDTIADTFLERQEERGQLGKNPKHRAQWRSSLTKLLPESFRSLAIDAITPKDVFDALDPIWSRTPETGSRLRGRIEAVLEFAREHDDVRPNPAALSGWLKTKLGDARSLGKIDRLTGERVARGHHPAMPYRDVPAFIAKLKATPGEAAAALWFAILCASRSNEVFGMRWDEVDLAAGLWTVPADRMKAGVEHVVPLPDAAVEILQTQFEARGNSPFVFHGRVKPGKPLSDMAMTMAMRRLKAGAYTPHGFRSAFRDWAAEHGVEFEVAEACLAHKVGNAVTQAYLRTTMLERRRKVMSDWASFLACDAPSATVVPFKGKNR